MRLTISPELERGRVRKGALATDPKDGRMGMFFVRSGLTMLKIIASDGRDWKAEKLPGEPWEHVSVSTASRCPTWEEMCFVKDLFWAPDETVVQYHPPLSDYINRHPYCLHLWRPTGTPVVLPPQICV